MQSMTKGAMSDWTVDWTGLDWTGRSFCMAYGLLSL
jgi:hypothetical protein